MIINKTLLGTFGIGVISLAYWWEAKSLPTGLASAPGTGYVPNLIGEISLGLCVLLAVITCLENRADTAAKSEPADEKTGPGPWIIAVALVLYPIILENLGFILGTTPLAYISLRVIGYKQRLRALVIALIMVLVSYYIFSQWLNVQFPAGWFG